MNNPFMGMALPNLNTLYIALTVMQEKMIPNLPLSAELIKAETARVKLMKGQIVEAIDTIVAEAAVEF